MYYRDPSPKYPQIIGSLTAADILIGVLYGLVPVTYPQIRGAIALVQLAAMCATMWTTARWILEDY